jgi:hypothetical protein
MTTTTTAADKIVYWHKELPPLSADVFGEDTVEATSGRVPTTLSHRDASWERCYADLMERTRLRLEQEVTRRGGRYAHVRDEAIASKSDEAKGESWLYGRFRYVLYR